MMAVVVIVAEVREATNNKGVDALADLLPQPEPFPYLFCCFQPLFGYTSRYLKIYQNQIFGTALCDDRGLCSHE